MMLHCGTLHVEVCYSGNFREADRPPGYTRTSVSGDHAATMADGGIRGIDAAEYAVLELDAERGDIDDEDEADEPVDAE